LAPTFCSLGLELLGLSLQCLLDGLESLSTSSLASLRREAGRWRAPSLMDLDLLVDDGGENDRELRLLFDRAGGGTAAGDGERRPRTAAAAETPHFSRAVGELGGRAHGQAFRRGR